MSAAPEHVTARHGVVVAVDPHKASWTAVVVTPDLAAAGEIRVEVNRAGYRQRLREDGIAVIDVPAKLARWPRLLSTGHGRKSDQADALSDGCRRVVGSGVAVAEALRHVRPRDTLRRTLRTIAVDQGIKRRQLDRRIAGATQALSDAVTASGTTRTDLLGIGDVVTATMLATGGR